MKEKTKRKQLSLSQAERSEINPPLTALKRNRFCWHLDFRLLASNIKWKWDLVCSLAGEIQPGRSDYDSFRSEILSNLLRVFHWSFCHLIVVRITRPETKVQDQVRSATPQLKADSSTDGLQIQYLSDAWRVHKSFYSALGGRKVDQGENPE